MDLTRTWSGTDLHYLACKVSGPPNIIAPNCLDFSTNVQAGCCLFAALFDISGLVQSWDECHVGIIRSPAKSTSRKLKKHVSYYPSLYREIIPIPSTR